MPNPAIVCTSDTTARLGQAGGWLREHAGHSEQTRGVVVLAPTRGAADALLRDLAGEVGGLLAVERLTLTQLAGELAVHDLADRGLVPVSSLGTEALSARAVAQCLEEDRLRYFTPVARLPGFARALTRTLLQLRSNEVTVASLLAGTDALVDLGHLLRAYETSLVRWSLADVPALLQRAKGCIHGRPIADPRLNRPLLVLDVVPANRSESQLLDALIQQAPDVMVTFAANDDVARSTFGPETIEPRMESWSAQPNRLARLRLAIFEPSPETRSEDGAPGAHSEDESLDFFGAPGESRECVEIARRIRDLGASDIAFDDIAILLRDPSGYLPLVEDALHRAEIPAYFTRGTARPHPAGRAFLSLLACADERLSAARFAEYLSLGQVPAVDDDGAPPEPEAVPWVDADSDQMVFASLLTTPAGGRRRTTVPDPAADDGHLADADADTETDETPVLDGTLRTPKRWERLLVDAAVVGGRDRWARRLSGLEAEIALRRNDLADDDEPLRNQLDEQLTSLRHLRRFALPAIDHLAALPETAVWGAWLDALERLASRVLREPERVLAALAELRPMAAVGPVALDEVRRTLEERLTMLRTEPPARPYGRVFVGTLEECRGRSFGAVFVPGLAEGLFPRRASQDPLLLDEARRTLDAALETQVERVAKERMLLRLAIGAARQRLVISYPNLDTLQGRARVPSFYALDVLRAADGVLPDLGKLERLAATRTASLLGWPAPRKPEQAIDDAEYDLAVLAPLLRRPASQTRGRGRYLLDTNDHLARALRTRARRWRGALSAADGIVDPDEATLAVLDAHRLRTRSYSPTALQRYAECPYKFLLYAVHRLRPRDQSEALEQLDPLTRGSLFHHVQRVFLDDLRSADLLPVNAERLPAALVRVDRALDTVATEAKDRLAPAIEQVWTSEIESMRTDLHGWLHAVVGAGGPWKPAHFELSFGLPTGEDHDAASSAEDAVVLDGIRLRGSIDLVEIDEATDRVRVTDHKTGLPHQRAKVVVGRGEVLQPLLYALAAEQQLARPVVAGRLFYCTRRGRFETREVPLDDATRGQVSEVLATIDAAVDTGFFPAVPRDRACRYCDYSSVCGPNETQRRKVKMKHPTSKQRLHRLEALRRQE